MLARRRRASHASRFGRRGLSGFAALSQRVAALRSATRPAPSSRGFCTWFGSSRQVWCPVELAEWVTSGWFVSGHVLGRGATRREDYAAGGTGRGAAPPVWIPTGATRCDLTRAIPPTVAPPFAITCQTRSSRRTRDEAVELRRAIPCATTPPSVLLWSPTRVIRRSRMISRHIGLQFIDLADHDAHVVTPTISPTVPIRSAGGQPAAGYQFRRRCVRPERAMSPRPGSRCRG